MSKFSLAIAAVALSASLAAVAPAQAQTNWTGFYAGANAGFGWIHDTGNAFCINPGGVVDGAGCDTNTAQQQHLTPSGAFGGFQGGYNWQFNAFVLGAEADFQGAGIDDSLTGPTATGGTFIAAQRMHWFGTVRPRFGYAGLNPVLLYGTGGLMVGGIDVSQDTFYTTGQYSSSKSSTKLGWTAGGGVEAMATPTISVKLEADYFDLGSETTQTFATGGALVGNGYQGGKKFTNSGALVRLGVNYHFGVPTPPPATPVVAAPPAPPPAATAPAKRMFIVFFEFDKSSLTADGQKVVDAAAAAYKSGRSDIAIAGYTDLAGTQQYNLALSHRRADTVKAALVKDGVAAAAIGENWYGKENPRVPTADGVREPQNRRVEITM